MEQIEQVAIETLIPYKKNARVHSAEQINQIANSIQEFGFTNPILTDEKYNILSGHGRYEAAKKLKLKKVPLRLIKNLTDAQKKAYIIADNQIASNSKWDNDTLNLELINLQKLDYEIDDLGFGKSELDKIFETPDFIETNDDILETDYETVDDFMPSQVRMVQLFLNSETEPKFKEMVVSLQNEYQTNNLTDTVFKAIEYAYNKK